MRDLRMDVFDVLVGVNLLREGLDLPEVSLVAILDADKEGFLRSDRALIQTIGRAARNVHSKAILYGDTITGSMQRAIDVTNRHREQQIRYNMEHGIVPKQIVKSTDAILGTTGIIERAAEEREHDRQGVNVPFMERTDKDPVAIYKEDTMPQAAEPRAPYGEEESTKHLTLNTEHFLSLTKDQLRKEIRERQRKMQLAAKELDFLAAAKYRDEIKVLQTLLDTAR